MENLSLPESNPVSEELDVWERYRVDMIQGINGYHRGELPDLRKEIDAKQNSQYIHHPYIRTMMISCYDAILTNQKDITNLFLALEGLANSVNTLTDILQRHHAIQCGREVSLENK